MRFSAQEIKVESGGDRRVCGLISFALIIKLEEIKEREDREIWRNRVLMRWML